MDISKVLAFASISLLAAMSPGPDFVLVTKNSLGGSLRRGAFTALGIGTALLIHVFYCVLGLGIVIQESDLLFNLIKYAGAAYLLYLGVLLLKEKSAAQTHSDEKPSFKHGPFVSGFICNLLNPKAALFVLSLFTQFVDPQMGFGPRMALGGVMALVTALWFLFLAYLLSHRLLQKHIGRFQLIISKVMGGALCLLALYVALRS